MSEVIGIMLFIVALSFLIVGGSVILAEVGSERSAERYWWQWRKEKEARRRLFMWDMAVQPNPDCPSCGGKGYYIAGNRINKNEPCIRGCWRHPL